MNPKALGFYWFFAVAVLAVALAAPHLVWAPLAAFAVYFVWSVV